MRGFVSPRPRAELETTVRVLPVKASPMPRKSSTRSIRSPSRRRGPQQFQWLQSATGRRRARLRRARRDGLERGSKEARARRRRRRSGTVARPHQHPEPQLPPCASIIIFAANFSQRPSRACSTLIIAPFRRMPITARPSTVLSRAGSRAKPPGRSGPNHRPDEACAAAAASFASSVAPSSSSSDSVREGVPFLGGADCCGAAAASTRCGASSSKPSSESRAEHDARRRRATSRGSLV